MKKFIFPVLFLACCTFSYAQNKTKPDLDKIRDEIRVMEQNFQKDLLQSGVAFAFHKYAADNAVIKRENDTLVIGREAIRNYYSNPAYSNAIAVWSPDYIDVSGDGTMAYTYGRYSWEFKDKEGKITNYKGVFHTVWKKMSDGSWKYVWD